mgnify:CR=1 FL=1
MMRCDECNSNVDGERVLCVGCAEAFSESLRAENERLREALRAAAKHAERCNPESGVVHFGVDSGVAEWQRDMVVVRAALADVWK